MKKYCYFLLLLIGCNTSESSLSDAEYIDFFESIEKAVDESNSEFLDAVFDSEHLVEKIVQGIPAPDYYLDGFKESFNKVYTPGRLMANTLGESTSFTFLRMTNNDPPTGLFRIVSQNYVNYQELYVGVKEGKPVIRDFYTYQEGESFSDGVRRLYIINLAQESEEFEHPFASVLPRINEAAQLGESGEVGKAFVYLQGLPEEVLDQKIVLLMMLTMGADLGQDSLMKASEIFKQRFPDDPLLELKLFDFSFQTQDTAYIFERLAALQNKIGKDPYLDVLKGAMLKGNGQGDQAEPIFLDALEAEPKLEDTYWLLFDLLIKKGEYERAVSYFPIFRDVFEQNPADFLIFEDYGEFFESEPYQKWIEENPISDGLDFDMDSLEQVIDQIMKDKDHHHGHDHSHHGHSH